MLPSEASSKTSTILKILQHKIFAAFSDFHPLLLERVKTFIDITKQEVGNKLGFDKPITVLCSCQKRRSTVAEIQRSRL